ncbi:MAG: hypothetical protein WDA68_00950 [Phycisphaerae bacterium]
MKVEPLKWPIEYKRGFLADIPVIGSDFRLRKAFYRQLKSRSHETLELWGNNVNILRCLCIVSPIAKECFNWPNTCFIPNDPCEILFWDPTIDWRDAAFINHIKKELSLSGNFWDDVNSLTYGQFIEKVIKHLNESR